MKRLYSITIMSVFLWMGFICAISFMEAWLKFQAPGVSIPIGLGIGKIVFGALNKVEWVFAIIISICFFINKNCFGASTKFLFCGILLILITQTFWLLPLLDARADAIVNGAARTPSSLHWIFVVAEMIKLALLFYLGTAMLRYIYANDFKSR